MGTIITLRYEIMTRERVVEDTIEAPDNWDSMTEDEREEYCEEAIQSGMCNVIGTSYDWDGEPQ